MTIHDITQKIENEGATARGRVTAEEFNTVVSTVATHDNQITRVTYWDMVNSTQYGFASESDRDAWLAGDTTIVPTYSTVFQFAGKQKILKVINLMPSTNIYFATNQSEAIIEVGFLSQEKDITAADWTEVAEDALFTVYVDRGATGTYQEVVSNKLVLYGNNFSFDIKNYLSAGANRVRIVAVGSASGESGSLQLSVTLTSMYLEPSNFAWYTPFIEGNSYNLGGFHIGGNLTKTLKIRVSKEGYEKVYEQYLGTNTYTTTAYYFSGLEFPESGSGVYNVECWLDANGLESDHLSYNIIFVSAADHATGSMQFVAVNNIAEKVYNFADNKLFQYVIYNGGQTIGTPHITLSSIVNNTPTVFLDEDLANVRTGVALDYTASLEVELQDENFDITLDATMAYGNEQEVLYAVDNSKSFPATTGAVFYLNASSRSNAQENREFVVNSVNSATYEATFNRMAWADGVDGWTVDDNGRKCLRLPAMSPMEFAYQPLASVDTQNGKTLEFVFKVSNVADYDEPIITIGDVYQESTPTETIDYDIAFNTNGFFTQSGDSISSSSNYKCSDPVFLAQGDSISFKITNSAAFTCVRETDETGTFIQSVVTITNTHSSAFDVSYTAERDMWVEICTHNNMISTYPPYITRIEYVEGGYNKNFSGIKITPKNVLIHSADKKTDNIQDYNTIDEEVINVIVTIIPNYKEVYGNMAQIYVNGVKARSFEYEDADRWNVSANVKLGNQTSDFFLYKMRVYDRGFGSADAMTNYINSLPTTNEKEAKMAELLAPTNDSYELDYDTCVKNGLNTMVIEILGTNQNIPSIAHQISPQCNLWIDIKNKVDGEMDEDFDWMFSGNAILNQTIEGQGTTSMTYSRWNFRWKLDKTYNKRRITAKKNVASSMHSHKMGATRLFSDLNEICVGANEVGKRVAVYQYPVYGFQKILREGTTDVYDYVPIGLYTIGPDKGDKATFGFDDETYEASLIHMEGTDHTPLGVGMDYPWSKLVYSGSAEALGAINNSGETVAAWEVGAAGEYDPKDNPTEVKAMLDVEFKPAYEVAYNNSPFILGVTTSLADMNANVKTWRAQTDADGRSYSILEFWTDGVYDLYFFNTQTQLYEANGVNVLTDLGLSTTDVDGLTVDEKNAMFQQLRRERFAANWGNYWHTQDAIFHYTFVEIFGATDNFKKNTYPYKFKLISDGGLYRWRQDDLDTLFDINNQGFSAKSYSVLVGDSTDTENVFRGEDSVFWTLIKETQQTEIKAMAHKIFNAMVSLAPYEGATLEKLVGCVRHYFWDFAQDYFPPSAYNVDAEWTYEDPWAAGWSNGQGISQLRQSLGAHYEAERDWVTMRILFTASYFNYGPFNPSGYQDDTTGQLSYGGAGAFTFQFTPSVDFNPTILIGQSELVTVGDRVNAGDTAELTASTNEDTRIYVQGVDWMEDIGDLSTLKVSSSNSNLVVGSKRMQRLKIGDETAENVTSNITALELKECPSMMVVDARNIASLTGSVDLSKLPRLLEAYFGGTAVKSISVPNGSKIQVLELSPEMTQLVLQNLKFMDGDGLIYDTLNNVRFLQIEGCDQLNPFAILRLVYNSDNQALRDIRIVGFDTTGDANDLTMIANMVNDVDKDGNAHIYNGIDQSGKPIDDTNPVIEGKLTIDSGAYEDDIAVLNTAYPNLVLDILGGVYIRFADPEVLSVLLAKNVGDGIGITVADAEAVTSMNGWFLGNTSITHFNELVKFNGLTEISPKNDGGYGSSYFRGATGLEEVTIPSSVTRIGSFAFSNCTSLNKVTFEDKNSIIAINATAFGSCPLQNTEIDFPNLVELTGASTFYKCSFQHVKSLGKITSIPTVPNAGYSTGCFRLNTNLESVVLPETLTSIGIHAFNGCTSLSSINIPNAISSLGAQAFYNCTSLEILDLVLPNLTSLGQNAFYGVKITKISDLGQITALPTASKSTQNFGDKSTLTEVLLPDTITTIPNGSFYNYTNCVIEDLNLPNLTSLGGGAFNGTKLRKISSLGNITALPADSGNTGGVFANCTELTYVDQSVFDKLTTVANAFANCTNLVIDELRLPSLTKASAGFKGCKIKKVLDLGLITELFGAAQLVSSSQPFGIPSYLEEYVIPSTVTSIGRYAFTGMVNLSHIICNATTPPTLQSLHALGETTCPIYVPDPSVDAYKTATNWATHANRIKPLTEYDPDYYEEDEVAYGVEWDVTVSSTTMTRIGNMSLHRSLPIHKKMKGCLLDDDGNVVEYLPEDDWTGATLDGSAGQVMVEIPTHYRKFETIGNVRRCWISEYHVSGYHKVPKMYISAYEATVQRSTNKLASVMNNSTDYRGGSNRADWDGTYRTLLGRPASVRSRTQFREYARNRKSGTSEWNCQDYNAYKSVFWLYYVEYANRNCQLAFTAEKDANGYAQGGLGNGVSIISVADWTTYFSFQPFVPCGHTNSLGNASGEIAYDVTLSDNSILATVNANRYRGIENPFGHIWKWTDGINLLLSPTSANGGDDTTKVYIADDPANYNDDNYDGYSMRGLAARNVGYVREVVFGDFGDIAPFVSGGGSTTYWADYITAVIPTTESLFGVLCGGDAYSGDRVGFAYLNIGNSPNTQNTHFGTRLCFIPDQE